VRFQVFELDQHVFLDGDAQLLISGQTSVILGDDPAGRLGLRQPGGDGWQLRHQLGAQQGLHRPAPGVSAHHDVLDPQHGDRVFDRGRLSAVRGAVGGHDVAGVAQREQLARIGLREQVGDDPRV
jgi:hypothetical protein